MTKNQIHEWHDRSEDGLRRYVRGYWDSREWKIRVLNKEVGEWQLIEKPSVELWVALRDVLWRKYQRKRIPVKFIQKLDAILEEHGVKAEPAL